MLDNLLVALFKSEYYVYLNQSKNSVSLKHYLIKTNKNSQGAHLAFPIYDTNIKNYLTSAINLGRF